MKKQEILGISAFQKTIQNYIGRIGLAPVYEMTDSWQKKEILSNHLAIEAEDAQKLEYLLQEQSIIPIIVSKFAVNMVLLERLLTRYSVTRPIFVHSIKD